MPEVLEVLCLLVAGLLLPSCIAAAREIKRKELAYIKFSYPRWTHTLSGRFIDYDMSASLCDNYICDLIKRQGCIDQAQILMQELLDSNSVLLDVGSHMAEYMPISLLQGADYISLEASPPLTNFQSEVLARNGGEWKGRARFLHGYFSASSQTACLETSDASFNNFIVLGCQESTVQIPRYDMNLLRDLKWEFPGKLLFVKYDAMINLCEFNSSTYLGDYVDYEYVNSRTGGQFLFGFPECFGGKLEEHYDVFVPADVLVPVETIPQGIEDGRHTHVVLIHKRIRLPEFE